MKKLLFALPLTALGGCATTGPFQGVTLAQLKADAAFACGLEPTSSRIARALTQNQWVVTADELARIVCGIK